MGSRPPNSDDDLFGCKFGFGKCFGASSWSNHWASHCRLLYTVHFSSHITIWLRNGSLLCRIREDDTTKRWFFWFLVSSRGTHLSSFFTFPICFKCWMTIVWSMVSSLATSHVAVRESISVILSTGHCQFTMVLATTLLIFKALVCFAKHFQPPLHSAFIRSSWAKCIVDVASCLHCFMTHFELE